MEYEPRNFYDLVNSLHNLEYGDYCENDDNNHSVEIGSIDGCVGRYILYRDGIFAGTRLHAEQAAEFIVEGTDWR